jgi:hypothetical protein
MLNPYLGWHESHISMELSQWWYLWHSEIWEFKKRVIAVSIFYQAETIKAMIINLVNCIAKHCGTSTSQNWRHLMNNLAVFGACVGSSDRNYSLPSQGILKGDLYDWFGISCVTNDNFCFYLQDRLIQTSQTGGQWYSSPFSIPWLSGKKLFKCVLSLSLSL